jgi:hypothetical protein
MIHNTLHICTKCYNFRHQAAILSLLTTKYRHVQHELQLPIALTSIIKIKNLKLLKFSITYANQHSPYCCNNTTIQYEPLLLHVRSCLHSVLCIPTFVIACGPVQRYLFRLKLTTISCQCSSPRVGNWMNRRGELIHYFVLNVCTFQFQARYWNIKRFCMERRKEGFEFI